ncbi:MAG: sigma-70 family RNA polymerase sigma factor [Minicystis sp.]
MARASGPQREVAVEESGVPAPVSGAHRAPAAVGPSDADLVRAAREGERWAKEAIFRRHARAVNAIAGRLLGFGADVDDLVQDTFVAALTSLDRLEKPEALGGWIAGIAVRLSHKRIRRRVLFRRLGLLRTEPVDLDAVTSTVAPPEVVAELRAIYAVVDRLPAEERVVLILRRVEGMELEAIAETMGRSLATVKRRLVNADEALAKWRAAGGAS